MADIKKQDTIQLSRVDHGKHMAQALIDGMLQNPDPIWQSQGNLRLDIYKDLLRDDQVKSCFQQRRSAVVNAEWIIETGDEREDSPETDYVRWLLGKIDFDQICDKMLYAIHYGYQVGELLFDIDEETGWVYLKDVKVRDRRRFKFGPEGELYLHDGIEKKRMPNDKFWILSVGADNSDNPYGEGLAHALYWYVFFKRNGTKFWLIYLEKFGMPTASAKLSRAQIDNPEQRAMALSILESIQADSGVVIPEDFEVDFLEAARSGTADYKGLHAAMDAAISKIILSQTMTTDDGSSRSQAEVHKGVRDEVIKTDADILCHSFNTQVLPRLIEYNFANGQIPKLWRRTEPEEDLKELAQRDNEIAKLGFEPSEEYIQETYGPGWKKKEEPQPPVGNPLAPLGPEFAEVSDLTQKRIGHRKDQQSLVEAAEFLSTKYREVLGSRVDTLLARLDESQDFATFQEHLKEMLAEAADERAADTIANATFYSRLMGLLKGQR